MIFILTDQSYNKLDVRMLIINLKLKPTETCVLQTQLVGRAEVYI